MARQYSRGWPIMADEERDQCLAEAKALEERAEALYKRLSPFPGGGTMGYPAHRAAEEFRMVAWHINTFAGKP